MPNQRWNPDKYELNARFNVELAGPVLQLLKPTAAMRVLDLGAGGGELTLALVDAGCEVVAVDASEEQTARARTRGLDARVMSGAALTFEREFDAVFSNAALHWMTDADGVARSVARALRPGGRFVAEMGGQGCVAAIRTALTAASRNHGGDFVSPWYFPSPAEHGARLARAGFHVDHIELVYRPTLLPTGIEGWLETFADQHLVGLGTSTRGAVFEEATTLLDGVLRDAQGHWFADYTRLRFAARTAN